MFNLIRRQEDPWPEHLKPIGEGERFKESFDEWWKKHHADFSNLHADVVSQWVYRHWKGSPFSFLDLKQLVWREELFSTVEILSNVHLEWGQDKADTPERDYEIFRPDRPNPLQTGQLWNNGSWLHPMPVLHTPYGIKGHDGDFPEKRYLVLDGSKRYRWLRALHHRGIDTGPHKVFVHYIRP